MCSWNGLNFYPHCLPLRGGIPWCRICADSGLNSHHEMQRNKDWQSSPGCQSPNSSWLSTLDCQLDQPHPNTTFTASFKLCGYYIVVTLHPDSKLAAIESGPDSLQICLGWEAFFSCVLRLPKEFPTVSRFGICSWKCSCSCNGNVSHWSIQTNVNHLVLHRFIIRFIPVSEGSALMLGPLGVGTTESVSGWSFLRSCSLNTQVARVAGIAWYLNCLII